MGFALKLLGEFRLSMDDGRTVCPPDRARALLAYLSAAEEPVSRATLAALLAPDEEEPQQRKYLRQALYLARRSAADDIILIDANGCLLLNEARVIADVREFRRKLLRGDDGSLAAAVELYRGPFLGGEKAQSRAFEDWLREERRELSELLIRGVLRLCGSDLANGRFSSALERARHALTFDPLCEEAHRIAMTSLVGLGERSSALIHYDRACKVLWEDLGVKPEAATRALYEAITLESAASTEVSTAGLSSRPQGEPEKPTGPARTWWPLLIVVASVVITVGILTVTMRPRVSDPQSSARIPSVAVLPFLNASGDTSFDGLAYQIADELITLLAAHPGLNVLSRSRTFKLGPRGDLDVLRETLGAKYVLEGTVNQTAGKLEISALLIGAETGFHIWSQRFDADDLTVEGNLGRVASDIQEALIGFKGEIVNQEQRQAWQGLHASTDEQNYVLRGEQLYFRFTKQSHTQARKIWKEGLSKFPTSSRLRAALAFSYRHAVEAGISDNPEQDLASACRLGSEASRLPQSSRFEQLLINWLMAKLAQWCDGDFDRSVALAETAAAMVPYDASARADLAELLANAGRTGVAINWLEQAIARDPRPPDWYYGNLAWAYYLRGEYKKGLRSAVRAKSPRPLLVAVLKSRLGIAEDDQQSVREVKGANPSSLFDIEARKPLVAPLKQLWLNDLRRVGLQDR